MRKSYKELRAWQLSVDAAVELYHATSRFPDTELFGLTSQLRRAGVSVPSNVAEGQGRITRGEWKQSLGHSRGSVNEIETQLEIAYRLDFLPRDVKLELEARYEEIGRTINGLIRYVAGK